MKISQIQKKYNNKIYQYWTFSLKEIPSQTDILKDMFAHLRLNLIIIFVSITVNRYENNNRYDNSYKTHSFGANRPAKI